MFHLFFNQWGIHFEGGVYSFQLPIKRREWYGHTGRASTLWFILLRYPQGSNSKSIIHHGGHPDLTLLTSLFGGHSYLDKIQRALSKNWKSKCLFTKHLFDKNSNKHTLNILQIIINLIIFFKSTIKKYF